MTGTGRDEEPPARGPGPAGRPPLPDPGPFRRIQIGTAALIAGAAVITLLSDERPGAVRWGTLVGLIVLIVTIYVVTRRRRPHD